MNPLSVTVCSTGGVDVRQLVEAIVSGYRPAGVPVRVTVSGGINSDGVPAGWVILG